jgi:hypothetical protein
MLIRSRFRANAGIQHSEQAKCVPESLARSMLVDDAVNKPDKAVMLAWLFHLVGDSHQPLHATALFSPRLFAEGDRGGNLIKTKQRGNLHSVWDGFLGSRATLREAHNDALVLLQELDTAPARDPDFRSLDEKVWLDESWRTARDDAYAPLVPHLRTIEKAKGELSPITLDEDYLKRGGALSKLRVVTAGYRLAAVLKQIVD